MVSPIIAWLLLEWSEYSFFLEKDDLLLAPLLGFGLPLSHFCLKLVMQEGIWHQVVVDTDILAASLERLILSLN